MGKQIVYGKVDLTILEKLMRIGPDDGPFLSSPDLLLENGNLVKILVFPSTGPVYSFEELLIRKRENKIVLDKENKVVYIHSEGYDTLSYVHLEKEKCIHYMREFYEGRLRGIHVITGGFLHGRDVLYSNAGPFESYYEKDYIEGSTKLLNPAEYDPLPREVALGKIDPELLTKELFQQYKGSLTADLRESYFSDMRLSVADNGCHPNLDQQEGNVEEDF